MRQPPSLCFGVPPLLGSRRSERPELGENYPSMLPLASALAEHRRRHGGTRSAAREESGPWPLCRAAVAAEPCEARGERGRLNPGPGSWGRDVPGALPARPGLGAEGRDFLGTRLRGVSAGGPGGPTVWKFGVHRWVREMSFVPLLGKTCVWYRASWCLLCFSFSVSS